MSLPMATSTAINVTFTTTPKLFNMSENQDLTPELKEHELQNLRSLIMDSLYKFSGRTSGHYTGLWQEFSLKLASSLRDADLLMDIEEEEE